MSTVRANIYSKTSGADIGTLFNPYTGTAAVSTGIYTISGEAYVDLNTRFAKYTGANGTAEDTGILCLSGGVYFDLNTRFEKYAVAPVGPFTITGATYNTYFHNEYLAIVVTQATDGSITFNTATTLNYVIVGGGGHGGSSIRVLHGGGGGTGGSVTIGNALALSANTSYTLTVGLGGLNTGNAGNTTTFGSITATGGGGGFNAGSSGPGTGGATSTGGGGKGGNGGRSTTTQAANGGAGKVLPATIPFIIYGNTWTHLGGGAGGGAYNGGNASNGGLGGGGAGGNPANSNTGTSFGLPGTGGGGAGGNGNPNVSNTGQDGGDGVIILYYLNPFTNPYITNATYTTYTSNGYNVIMITRATVGVASITFSSTKTVNCLLLSAGGNGGKSGATYDSGGGGGSGGVALLTTTTFNANTSYSMALQIYLQGTQLGTLDTKTLGIAANGGTSRSDTLRATGGTNLQGYGSGGNSGYNATNGPTSGSPGYLLPTTISFIINGTTYTRVAGGGGGGKFVGQSGTGAAGANGGGASGAAGTPNTGGGGGGGQGNTTTEILGGSGGSGFIAIWYQ